MTTAPSPRMGLFDLTAVELLHTLIEHLEDNDAWQDTLEDLLVRTDPTAEALVSVNTDVAQDHFYAKVDQLQERLLARVGKALINMYTNSPDLVVDAYRHMTEDKAMQT